MGDTSIGNPTKGFESIDRLMDTATMVYHYIVLDMYIKFCNNWFMNDEKQKWSDKMVKI